jgi:hypothetical protein
MCREFFEEVLLEIIEEQLGRIYKCSNPVPVFHL